MRPFERETSKTPKTSKMQSDAPLKLREMLERDHNEAVLIKDDEDFDSTVPVKPRKRRRKDACEDACEDAVVEYEEAEENAKEPCRDAIANREADADGWRPKRARPNNANGDADEKANGFFLEADPVVVVRKASTGKRFKKGPVRRAKSAPPELEVHVDPRVIMSGCVDDPEVQRPKRKRTK